MTRRKGISMAELMVAVAIISLAVGPLIAVLTSSNQMSNHSIYEEMSVHYCREITDQLLRLTPKIPHIVDSARKATGNPSLSFGDLINDLGFNQAIDADGYEGECVPFQNLGRKTDFRLFVARMDQVFNLRNVRAVLLDSSGNSEFKDGRFWKITVTVGWRPSENEPARNTSSVIVIGDLS